MNKFEHICIQLVNLCNHKDYDCLWTMFLSNVHKQSLWTISIKKTLIQLINKQIRSENEQTRANKSSLTNKQAWKCKIFKHSNKLELNGSSSHLKKGKKKKIKSRLNNPFSNLVNFKLTRFGSVTLPNNYEHYKTLFILTPYSNANPRQSKAEWDVHDMTTSLLRPFH